MSVAAEPVLHQRTKHIGIKFQYTNENIANGMMKNAWVPSSKNWADMMTKAQGRNLFGEHYPLVMGGSAVPQVPDLVKTVERMHYKIRTAQCSHCYQKILNFRRSVEVKCTSFYMLDLTLLYWKVNLYFGSYTLCNVAVSFYIIRKLRSSVL